MPLVHAPPRRIQRKRTRGWRKPPGAANVTRPGKWGNPYPVLKHASYDLDVYRKYLVKEVAAGRLDLEEIRGKDLMCWCKPGTPCHGDILLELANKRIEP